MKHVNVKNTRSVFYVRAWNQNWSKNTTGTTWIFTTHHLNWSLTSVYSRLLFHCCVHKQQRLSWLGCVPESSLMRWAWTVLGGAEVQQAELNLVRELRQSSYNTSNTGTTLIRLWWTVHNNLFTTSQWNLSLQGPHMLSLTCRQGKLPNNGLFSSIRRRSAYKQNQNQWAWIQTNQRVWQVCTYLYSGWCKRRWTSLAPGL